MKRDRVAVLVYIALAMAAAVLLGNFITSSRDVSWISAVEESIQQENWVPDREFIGLAEWSFFLHENGTEQFFFPENREQLISSINKVMNNINRRIEENISTDYLGEILTEGQVLEVSHRFSTKSELWRSPNNFGARIDYDKLFFVLEDFSENDLKGTIIVREHSFIGSQEVNYSIWEVSKGAF